MWQWNNKPRPAIVGCLYTAFAAFFVLVGYEFTRSASNTLFKDAYGIHSLPMIMTLIPLGVFVCLVIYNKTLSQFGPKRTLQICLLGSAACFVLCYVGISRGSRVAAGFLFIIREAYVVLLIEQFWSYLNSVLTENEAKAWNGFNLGISTLGGVLGGLAVYFLAESLGSLNLILVSALLMIPPLYCIEKAYSLSNEAERQSLKSKTESPRGWSHQLGVDMFGKHPVLILILMLVGSSQVISTVCTLNFQNALELYVSQSDQQTSISGIFYSCLNGASFTLQFFLVPFLMKRMDPRRIHMGIPIIHATCAVMVIAAPSLWTIGFALMCFKSLDYSFFRSAKEILYIPLPFDARFRSKELIDVFGQRASKGLISGGITFAQQLGATMGPIPYGWMSLGASTLWLLWAQKLTQQVNPKGTKTD